MKKRLCFGISFCISGQITYTQNGKVFVSTPNNAVILPKNGTYSLYGDKEGIFPVIDFECEGLNIKEITVLPLQDAKPFIQEYHSLLNCFLYNHNKLKQYQLLYSILEKLDSQQSSNPLSATIAYVQTHISDLNLSNNLLAQKMGISEVYLRKLFISHLGVTPKQYILDLRIKTAKQLLVSSSKTVTEISEACGFASVYHFCRIFKQKTSYTPTDYISKHKSYQI